MGEIQSSNISQKPGAARIVKHRSTRVDLTPMVDLGFILITFFIFTSVMATPKAMRIDLPNDANINMHDELCASCVITLQPGAGDSLLYFEGLPKDASLHRTTYSAAGIRKILMAKKQAVQAQFGEDRMTVIIQPGNNSYFKQLIDLIDECNICRVKRYYIDEGGG